MPANDYGVVTNLTSNTIETEAFPGGIDGNEVDPEGNFRYSLPSGQAVAISTKLDQEFFLARPKVYEVSVKGRVLSKSTPESKLAGAEAKGAELLKTAAKPAKA